MLFYEAYGGFEENKKEVSSCKKVCAWENISKTSKKKISGFSSELCIQPVSEAFVAAAYKKIQTHIIVIIIIIITIEVIQKETMNSIPKTLASGNL